MPHAARGSGFKLSTGTCPSGYYLTPTAELRMIERGPISTNEPSILSMSQNRAIRPEKSICFPPLAAAQPLNMLSRPEAINVHGTKRACRMAISRSACSLYDLPEFAQAVRYGISVTPVAAKRGRGPADAHVLTRCRRSRPRRSNFHTTSVSIELSPWRSAFRKAASPGVVSLPGGSVLVEVAGVDVCRKKGITLRVVDLDAVRFAHPHTPDQHFLTPSSLTPYAPGCVPYTAEYETTSNGLKSPPGMRHGTCRIISVL